MLSLIFGRDPECLATLEAYSRAVQWIQGGIGIAFSQSDIDEALLSIFSSIDAPTPPQSKGLDQFLRGITPELKRAHRAALLNVTADQVVDVAARYLAPHASLSESSSSRGIAVVGPASRISVQGDEWNIQHTSELLD